jgi:DNA-binding NtrC family response regulator
MAVTEEETVSFFKQDSITKALKMVLFDELKKMRLLLVDDDQWIRDSLSLYFEAEGCHLFALETAEEGTEAVKKQDYDIIISDYRLPGMDGLEFLKRIKEAQPHAIRVLITAYGSKALVSEAKRIGIQGFIEKPFTCRTIEASLSRILLKREQEDQG